ncbi:UbiD family decarboxylase [Natrialbaceae archaeon A-gly3]
MIDVRTQIEQLDDEDDLLTIEELTHWDIEAGAVASEALRANGPALLFEETPGIVRLASGIYAGPDNIDNRERQSWRRLAIALSRVNDSYGDLLESVGSNNEGTPSVGGNVRDLEHVGADLYSLGLPTPATGGKPRVSLGVLCVEGSESTHWVPVHGTVQSSSDLRLTVPEQSCELLEPGTRVTVALGVSAAVLVAAQQKWVQNISNATAPAIASSLDGTTVRETENGAIPANAEVVLEGSVGTSSESSFGRRISWELAEPPARLAVHIDGIRVAPDPIVPFSPYHTPLADTIHLTSIVEAAALYQRVNNYWGVEPVNWIQLPAETGFGLCIVSSEILYAGFQWQLANALFSFSELFDKVLVLDSDSEPENLAGALDDMWVKAHPTNDWIFSEPHATRSTAPAYYDAETTGTRVYIDATWDPNWDEEYIAPRVSFEECYPENVREQALNLWNNLNK